ncbi:MAG: Trm112 family protein [Pirellulales bacterium]
MLSKDLLETLVCPESRTPLRLADEGLLAKLNQAVAAGRLKTRGGRPVAEPLAAGLVRADRTLFYPIVDDIPVMLVDEAIPLDQV